MMCRVVEVVDGIYNQLQCLWHCHVLAWNYAVQHGGYTTSMHTDALQATRAPVTCTHRPWAAVELPLAVISSATRFNGQRASTDMRACGRPGR